MNVDIQLILTHLVGFIITVIILAKFAWGPIMKLLEDRRQKIASEFEAIDAGKTEIADIRADFEAKMADIENVSRQKMTEAINEGQKMAAEIKEQSRDEAKEIIERAKSELQRDVEKARAALKEDMVKMTIAAAEKIITTKLDDKEDRRLITEYIDSVEKV